LYAKNNLRMKLGSEVYLSEGQLVYNLSGRSAPWERGASRLMVFRGGVKV